MGLGDSGVGAILKVKNERFTEKTASQTPYTTHVTGVLSGANARVVPPSRTPVPPTRLKEIVRRSEEIALPEHRIDPLGVVDPDQAMQSECKICENTAVPLAVPVVVGYTAAMPPDVVALAKYIFMLGRDPPGENICHCGDALTRALAIPFEQQKSHSPTTRQWMTVPLVAAVGALPRPEGATQLTTMPAVVEIVRTPV